MDDDRTADYGVRAGRNGQLIGSKSPVGNAFAVGLEIGQVAGMMVRRILRSMRLAPRIEVSAGAGKVPGAVALLMDVKAEFSVRR